MAEFNIPITVPNDKVQALVAALNWKWSIGGQGEMTPTEIRANLKSRIERMLKGIYKEHQQYLASQAADTDIDLS